MKLVFATNNIHKVREASEILGEGFEIVTPAQLGITEDIPETGNTLRSNSQQKADYIFEKTGLNCFADDSGLEVDILCGAPGVETARYAGEERNPSANMAKLLDEMARREMEASLAREFGIATPRATRKARFRTCVTLIIDGQRHFFDGCMEGKSAVNYMETVVLAMIPSLSLRAVTLRLRNSRKMRKTPFHTAETHLGQWLLILMEEILRFAQNDREPGVHSPCNHKG